MHPVYVANQIVALRRDALVFFMVRVLLQPRGLQHPWLRRGRNAACVRLYPGPGRGMPCKFSHLGRLPFVCFSFTFLFFFK